MPVARISNLGIVGKFAVSLIAVVVMQGILSFKFKVFGYFDLPLICSVYYGFTLGNPIASFLFTIGDSLLVTILGLMAQSTSSAAYSPVGAWLLSGAFNTLLGLIFLG